MKKISIVLALFSLLSLGAEAQNLNQVSLRLSPTQFELSFQRKLKQQKVWSEAFIGLGNQDINSKYDDFLAGIRIGIPLFSSAKNAIHLAASAGIYFPNNEYYSAASPVYGLIGGYTRYMGKAQRHSLLIHLGYQYGERNYIQEYQSADISTAITGTFKLSPIHFSIGYGFNF